MVEDMGDELDLASLADSVPETEDLLDQEDDAPIIRLINALLAEAIRENASDIHIETFEKQLVVRFRVDGVMREIVRPKRALAPLLVSRIKVMAKLDIAEKRVPQDGRISLRIGGREVDVRVSTMPASNGERVVLRLLDKQAGRLNLNNLGMSEKTLVAAAGSHAQAARNFPGDRSHRLRQDDDALFEPCRTRERDDQHPDVEDPIEYNLPGIGQTQVNNKADMTFARGLRAILRQDPDVVMVGEIRDLETAEIAVQASLTGHLVMSTLHTNTAVGAVMRLIDLGVEPYLMATSLVGMLAQRLVRVLCPDCREQTRADSFECQFLGDRPRARAEDLSRERVASCAVTPAFAAASASTSWSLSTRRLRELIHDRVVGAGVDATRANDLPRYSRRRPRQSLERRDDGSGNPPRHAGGLTGHGRLRVRRPRRRRTPEKGRDRGRQRPPDPPDSARPGTRAAVGRHCLRACRRPFGPSLALAARHVRTRPRVVHAPDVDAAGARRCRSKKRCAPLRSRPKSATSATMVMGIRSRVLEGHSLASSLGRVPERVFAPVSLDGDGRRTIRVTSTRCSKTSRRIPSAATTRRATSRWRCSIRSILFLLAIGDRRRAAGLCRAGHRARVREHRPETAVADRRADRAVGHSCADMRGCSRCSVAGAVFFVRWLSQQPDIRLEWDRRKFDVPLVRRITRANNSSRYASTLSILTLSGVPLVEAMTIAAEVVGNTWLKKRLTEATRRVSEGASLRIALESAGHFPPMMLHMVASGEASGELDQMLAKVADYQQQELERHRDDDRASVRTGDAAADGRTRDADRSGDSSSDSEHEQTGGVAMNRNTHRSRTASR